MSWRNYWNWAYLWINSLKFYIVCFCCMESRGLSKCIEIKMQTPCFHLILSFFEEWKDVWSQSPCLIFCIIFEEKYLSCYILFIDQIWLSSCLYFVRYWAICVLQLFVNQLVTCMNFEVNHIFLIKPFSYMTKTSWQKLKYLENEKSF